MRSFKRDNKSNRRKSKGKIDFNRRKNFNRSERRGPSRFNRRDSKRDSKIEMHKVICDKCGKECEVPFKPTPSKPVYCSDCFRKEDNVSKGDFSGLEEINKKLDKIMQALKIKQT